MSKLKNGHVQAVNQLPLYTAVYHYLREYDSIFMHIGRDRRHTVGQYAYNRICELFDDIRIAYDVPAQRGTALEHFRSQLCIISTMVKLLQEQGAISVERYQSLAALEADIIRQSGGWLKKTQTAVVDVEQDGLPGLHESLVIGSDSK